MYIHGMLSIKIIGRMESYSSKIVLFKTSLCKDLLRISTNKNGGGMGILFLVHGYSYYIGLGYSVERKTALSCVR